MNPRICASFTNLVAVVPIDTQQLGAAFVLSFATAVTALVGEDLQRNRPGAIANGTFSRAADRRDPLAAMGAIARHWSLSRDGPAVYVDGDRRLCTEGSIRVTARSAHPQRPQAVAAN
jgi:hypothetical protein